MAQRSRADTMADPQKANAEISAVLDKAVAGDEPAVPDPPGDLVRLPGGLVVEGETIRTATIRELTGTDEEALSRALASGSAFRFADVLITRGTAAVGNRAATPDLLRRLLIADRDEIAIGIRRATYGDTMTVESWQCPACRRGVDVSFSLAEDLERRPLADPARDTVFTVEHRGASAKARLPNGADQEFLLADGDFTAGQRNSRLLSKITESWTSRSGQEYYVPASPSSVLEMPLTLRQEIIRQVAERQPGPRYNQVRFTHEECGNEVTLALGLQDLFRELLSFL